MYVSITGNKSNQDVYIKQSYRKENGKTSSRIFKKLGKYNDLLAQFSGNEAAMMNWAKKEAEKNPFLRHRGPPVPHLHPAGAAHSRRVPCHRHRRRGLIWTISRRSSSAEPSAW